MSVDVQQLKEACRGHWPSIIPAITSTPLEALSGRHGPCPHCGGADRFRVFPDFAETGGGICNQCGTFPDGVAFVQHFASLDFLSACESIGQAAGVNGHARKPSSPEFDIIARVANAKKMPIEAFKTFGAVAATRGNTPVARVPQYGPDGQQCSHFDIGIGDPKLEKGLNAKGKSPGVFLPEGKLPREGMTVLVCEGVKDAAALHGAGYTNVVGLPTCTLTPALARLFKGVRVVIVPDRDRAGDDGSQKTAALLKGVAATVSIAALPAEWKETGGDGVREVLAQKAGPDMLKRAIEDAVPVEGTSVVFEFKTYTAAELATADFPQRYLIPNVLVEGQPCILAAPKKCLKTSVLIDMGVSLAIASRWLGYYEIPEAVRVGIMSGESGAATIQETYKRVCRSKGWNPEYVDGLVFSFQVPQFGRPEHMDALRRFAIENELGVLMVDPTYLCLDIGDQAGNLFSVGAELQKLTEGLADTGVTLMLAHHSKKKTAEPFVPLELEDIAWSGFQEWARQWILMNRRKLYDPEEAGHHELWLTTGGSAGHSGLWALDVDEGHRDDAGGRKWAVEVFSAKEARAAAADEQQQKKGERKEQEQSAQINRDMGKLRDKLANYPEGVTLTKLCQKARVPNGRGRLAIEAMVENGEAEECEVIAANKQTYEGYRRTTDSHPDTGTTPGQSGCPDGT